MKYIDVKQLFEKTAIQENKNKNRDLHFRIKEDAYGISLLLVDISQDELINGEIMYSLSCDVQSGIVELSSFVSRCFDDYIDEFVYIINLLSNLYNQIKVKNE